MAELIRTLADDSFSTFDGDTWQLSGDATHNPSRVRLTPASTDAAGSLSLRSGVTDSLWETEFRFDILNGSADPAHETTVTFFYDALSSDGWTPNNGYQVSFDHFDDEIRLDRYVDGQQKTIAKNDVLTIEDSDGTRNFARVKYTRGNVTVSLNGTIFLTHEIKDVDTRFENFAYTAHTDTETCEHIVDDIEIWTATNRNVKTSQSEWPSPAIDIGQNSNSYSLMNALLGVTDQQDKELEAIRRSHHIDTATDEELDEFGKLVQLDRKAGESDEKYRARLKVKFRVGNIGTTFDDFTEFASVLLDTNIENIEFITDLAATPATAQISAEEEIFDSVSLTRQEVGEFLGEAVPAGHAVDIIQQGTFALKVDGEADDPDLGLTSDSISTGGTLSGDLV